MPGPAKGRKGQEGMADKRGIGRIIGGCLLVLVLGMGIAAGTASTAANQGESDAGAETIELQGGVIGNVAFPHRLHQETEDSCNACHDLFPRKSGAISDRQEAGRIKKQQVMNEKCIACHRQRHEAGKDSGPLQCGCCHQR